ncbi:MAG: hypothetical protein RQ971_03005 [Armatimonadota bacterium]|nr:hypothetical protein [Armatimonadota bacterium]
MRSLTLVALGLLLSVNAFTQTIVDEFDGGFDPNLPWSWLVVIPDNDPNTCDLVNTENTDYYAFRDGELVLTMHPWNSVYDLWNYAVNFPNLPVAGMNAGWAIETEVTLDLNGNTPGVYTQAGIILMQDMDNYYSVQLVIDPNASPISYWLSTAHEVNRNYQYGGASAGYWGDGAPSFTLKMRIVDAEPDENGNPRIRVQVQLPGWTDFVDVWPSPFPMPNMVQAVAANGGRVGFFHVAGFEGDQQPIASFKYLKLENVRLVPRGDVDGNGCVDDADLLQVLFSFGESGDACLGADVNRDSLVDDADLLEVLFNFGAGC